MKESASPGRESRRKKGQNVNSRTVRGKRGWPLSLAWAAALVGTTVVLSAAVNPLFGRSVHWDWMAALAPTLFVVLPLSLRRRWV